MCISQSSLMENRVIIIMIYIHAQYAATQFGVLPQLEFDGGKRLSGNGTIARYLAEKYDVCAYIPACSALIYHDYI